MRIARLIGCRTLGLATVVLLASSLGVACAGTGTNQASSAPVLRVGTDVTPNTLNVAKQACIGQTATFFSLAYAPLIHMNVDGSLAPGLATAWQYKQDPTGPNTVFELSLRHDARFSDGTPVTAEAVKSWFDFFPKQNGIQAAVLAIKSVDIVDEWTVRLNLSSPNSNVPAALSDRAFCWGLVASQKATESPSMLTNGTYGAGPYELDPSRSIAGDHYTFVPNPYYFDKSAIHWREVDLRVIATPSSMLQAIQAGQLDIGVGDSSTAASANSSGLHVTTAPLNVALIQLSDRVGKSVPALADIRVRQALEYAIDRKSIAAALAGAYGNPTSEILTTDGFDPTCQDYYPYDPAKARQLLAAAGYPNGFSFDLLSGGFAGNLGTPAVAAVAKYWGAIGVRVNNTTAPTSSAWATQLLSGGFPVNEESQSATPMSLMWLWWAPNSPLDVFGSNVHETQLANLWESSNRAADPTANLEQMSCYVTENALAIPVFSTDEIWYSAKNIRGVALSLKAPATLATEWSPE